MVKKERIEIRNLLPRYPEDERAFYIEKVREIEPCSIADLVRHIGGEPRIGGTPSPFYNRVATGLHRTADSGGVVKNDRIRSWRVACVTHECQSRTEKSCKSSK